VLDSKNLKGGDAKMKKNECPFRKNVEVVLAEKGLKVPDLARRLGVGRQAVYQALKYNRPTIGMIERVEKALRLPAGTLMKE
jgi:transcriptional regulator with XRE-family HTH domain